VDARSWNPRSNSHVAARRPAVACWTDCEDKMLVLTDSPEVQKMRASVMEFELLNHPVDCPICDKAGECMLQDYYMQHDRKRSELRDEKVHKPRLVPFGKRILYNGERCILCSRCTRFTEHVTKTSELGIVNRGDRAIVEVVRGGDFDNPYSDNVADICPVGALTKTDFRFKQRVWFLKHTESVCGGCSRNCNTVVDHAGNEIVRIMPRERKDVNQFWICNEGRDLYKEFHAASRPEPKGDVAAAAEALKKAKAAADKMAAIVSPWMSNEEAWLFTQLWNKGLKSKHADLKQDRAHGYPKDEVLHTDDHNPNLRGVREAGIDPTKLGGRDLPKILAACEAGEIDLLLVWGTGLLNHFDGDPDRLRTALSRVGTIIHVSDAADAVSEIAQIVLPLRSWPERDGTWTNLDGFFSRFRRALRPPAGSHDGVELLLALCDALACKPGVKDLKEIRKKLKQDPDSDVRSVENGQFEFPHDQTLYRHVGGAMRV
jgi:NADH-quinone oxidoreductase subunit G